LPERNFQYNARVQCGFTHPAVFCAVMYAKRACGLLNQDQDWGGGAVRPWYGKVHDAQIPVRAAHCASTTVPALIPTIEKASFATVLLIFYCRYLYRRTGAGAGAATFVGSSPASTTAPVLAAPTSSGV
jgi:hypothetical protein